MLSPLRITWTRLLRSRMQPPGILQGNSVLRGDRVPRCKRHYSASHILGCAPVGRCVALTGPILALKTPCGSSSMQNSRQRIGFWSTCRVANSITLRVPALFVHSPWGISGSLVKIRSFGGSFEALVLQGDRFRRKRGVSEAGSEKAGVFVPVGQTPPLENNSQNGRGYAKRPLRILGCSVWAMLAAP